jgi:dTDP-4-amino-4,6-dideoxygalactose transaminase
MFYLNCNSLAERNKIIKGLEKEGVLAVFHYLSLHKSPFYNDKHDGRVLNNCDNYSERLLRLPLFFELEEKDQLNIIATVINLMQ